MSFASLVADIVARLDRAGIPYMLTGSLVIAYYGEPRATRDVDVVIDPDAAAETDSERQLRDVSAVLRILGPTLDRAYLMRWITKLGLGQVLARAEPEP